MNNIQKETQRISDDLRLLYDQFNDRKIARKDAETLANISGKNLKAQSILLINKVQSSGGE